MATLFIAQLLVDLRDAVRALRKENKDLKALLGKAGAKVDAQVDVEVQLWNQVAVLDARNVELVGRVNKLEKERVVFMLVFFICVAIVVGLWVNI